jgi:CYTH domain-containing protein
MKNVEIERRFVVRGEDIAAMLPDCKFASYKRSDGSVSYRIVDAPFQEIHQGYLKCEDGVSRLRCVYCIASDGGIYGTEFYWTIKGKGQLMRSEHETGLTADAFHDMLPTHSKVRIEKRRYILINRPGCKKVELDFFDNQDVEYIAEVEFETVEAADAYVPEKWMSVEVTNTPGYSNYDMAIKKLKQTNK